MSQLGKLIRRRLMMEPDYATVFPGDMHPDVAAPGTPIPYIVTTGSEAVVNYDLHGMESHIVEAFTMMVVCQTRAEAEEKLDWLRHVLRPPSWTVIPFNAAFGEYVTNYWRLESYSDGSDVAVEGDDSTLRTVSLNITGSFKYLLADPNGGVDKPTTDNGDDGLEH